MERRNIAVVGAGIGGLAAAALLAGAGHLVQVFDRFDAPRPVGSGLVIQPVGQAVLQLCGAASALALGARIKMMKGVEVERGRTVLSVAYGRTGWPRYGLAIHRGALFQALMASAMAAGAEVVAGVTVLAASLEAGKRWLDCTGQRLGPFDLVVDARGAGSPLSPLVARDLAYGAVWGTVPWPDASDFSKAALHQRYYRASKMAGVLPLGRIEVGGPDLAALFWSLPRAALANWPTGDLDAWKAEVHALWPEIAPFLETLQSPSDMTVARYSHGTLRRPYAKALVHIGDAAHRASPQLGQGANMALLDALALAQAVASGGDPGPEYARLRRWHVRLYQTMSAAFTPQYQSDSLWLPVLRDRLLMPISRLPPVSGILTRLVAGDLIPPLAGMGFPED